MTTIFEEAARTNNRMMISKIYNLYGNRGLLEVKSHDAYDALLRNKTITAEDIDYLLNNREMSLIMKEMLHRYYRSDDEFDIKKFNRVIETLIDSNISYELFKKVLGDKEDPINLNEIISNCDDAYNYNVFSKLIEGLFVRNHKMINKLLSEGLITKERRPQIVEVLVTFVSNMHPYIKRQPTYSIYTIFSLYDDIIECITLPNENIADTIKENDIAAAIVQSLVLDFDLNNLYIGMKYLKRNSDRKDKPHFIIFKELIMKELKSIAEDYMFDSHSNEDILFYASNGYAMSDDVMKLVVMYHKADVMITKNKYLLYELVDINTVKKAKYILQELGLINEEEDGFGGEEPGIVYY